MNTKSTDLFFVKFETVRLPANTRFPKGFLKSWSFVITPPGMLVLLALFITTVFFSVR